MKRWFSAQSIVEFATVVPVFFLMTFGVIEGGRLLFTYHEVSNAAKEAARYAAAHGCKSDTSVSTEEALRDFALDRSAGLNDDAFTLTATWDASGAPPDPDDPSCDGKKNRPGATIEVKVTYQFQPVVGMVFGMDPISLGSSSEMLVHY